MFIPNGTTSFKVTLPYALENNNYICTFNALYDSGYVQMTSRGTKDIWFKVTNAPVNDGGIFSFRLEYQLNN